MEALHNMAMNQTLELVLLQILETEFLQILELVPHYLIPVRLGYFVLQKQ